MSNTYVQTTNGRFALEQVAEASTAWCGSIQQSQITVASSVNYASQLLMDLYTLAKNDLNARMETYDEYKSSGGTLPTGATVDEETGQITIDGSTEYYFLPESSDDNYQSDVSAWQTQYGNISQQYTNAESEINTPISSMDTQVESLGNAAQQAISMGSTAIKPNTTLASLLGSAL